MSRDLFHIGQRKTATTWLQVALRRAAAAGHLTLVDSEVWTWFRRKPAAEALPEDFADLTRIVSRATGPRRVLSVEGLMIYDHAAMAEALKAAWPEASILVTTRNPADYLRSSYTQAIKAGRHQGAEQFAAGFARNHMMRSHDFNGLQTAYARHFGAENVHFYPYEDIRTVPSEFLTFFDELVGAPVARYIPETRRNVSPPPEILEMARVISEHLRAGSPEFHDRGYWQRFLSIALPAIGHAEEMWPEFLADMRSFGINPDVSPPTLSDAAKQDLAAMATVLGGLPRYAPYREAYLLDRLENALPR